jgi:hypothetical protein
MDDARDDKQIDETPVDDAVKGDAAKGEAVKGGAGEDDAGRGDVAKGGAGKDDAKGAAAAKGGRGAGGRRHLTELYIPGPWIAGMGVALVILLLVAIAGFAFVNDNRTCAWCHVIEPEAKSYETTAHHAAGVACQDCHTKPGVFNYFIRNIAGVTHIIENITGNYYKPVTTFVGTENCVQCHPKEEIERDIVVGNIRVNHTGLREQGYQCVTCHVAIAHGDAIPIGARPKTSTMATCWQCHNGVDESQRCSICHINGVPPGTAQVTMPLHMESGDCAQCHSKRFCARCHNGLTMPHPNGWPRDHGETVLARGKSICAGCHTDDEPQFCVKCHGLVMPHPSGWLSRHDTIGQDDPQVCVKCHGKDSCVTCHGLRMPHPSDWEQTHPSTATSNPSLCTKCHGASSCTACHGVSLPHSESFIDSHWNTVPGSGGVCVKCHGNLDGGAAGCYGGECHRPGSTLDYQD